MISRLAVMPDQVHDMPEGHLERPRDHGPEAECRQEFRREPEIVLDEEGADDGCQPLHAGGDIDHQRRQVGELDLAAELQHGPVEPVIPP